MSNTADEPSTTQASQGEVADCLPQQVMQEQPQFQAGAPLGPVVWKRVQHNVTTEINSSSSSHSGSANKPKPQSSDGRDDDCASTSSSSHPITALSEEDEEENDATTDTADTTSSSAMIAPINPEEMEERKSAASTASAMNDKPQAHRSRMVDHDEDENDQEENNLSSSTLNDTTESSGLPSSNSPVRSEERNPQLKPPIISQQRKPPLNASIISEEGEGSEHDKGDEEVAQESTASRIQGEDDNPSRAASPPPEKRLDWSFLRSGVLYDREEELEVLQSAFQRQLDGGAHEEGQEEEQERPSFSVVSGLSGTGKSALTRAALEPLVKERNGYYLQGKFDQLQHSEPYAPFVNAMNDYVYYVLQEQEYQNEYEHITSLSCLETLQTEILSALSPEGCSVLLQMIPSLSHILHIHKDDSFHNQHRAFHQSEGANGLTSSFNGGVMHATNTNGTSGLWESSQDRVKVIFRRFLRVICKPERPCCLILDDLQWGDAASLDLMESLVCDVQNYKGLFLVGICRSNEISMDHNLANLLRRLEDEHNAQIRNVTARNLTYNATNQLICDVLKQSWDTCLPLTEIIHAQTEGNVFYVMNYIKAIHADRVLIPDQEFGTDGWLWDEDRWQQLYSPHAKKQRKNQFSDDDNLLEPTSTIEASDSDQSAVVDLIARQLRRLSEPTQLFLRTCACIGAEIDIALVEKVLEEMDILASTQLAVDEGLLVVVERSHDGRHFERRTSYSPIPERTAEEEQPHEDMRIHAKRRFRFAHDGIQQAAYSLILDSNKSAAHLSVGRMLFKNMMTMEEFNEHLFVVVNQMNRGMAHIDDQFERDGLAALNLKAGNRAILSSDFHTAVQYFMVGTTLLAQSPHHWARQYELSLELYNSLAEAEYCVADFEMMDVAVLEVLQNGLDFKDMIRAYAAQVYALGARFMLQEAIDLGLQVLERFNEFFSNPSPNRKSCLRAFSSPMKTKRKLSWKTKSQLLYMPDMNDPDKLAAMGILNLLTTYSLIGRPPLFPFIAARLVKLSLDHGLCAISAPGFAFYGLWLCSIGEPQAGYRYGTLALDILERYQNTITEWVPRVYSVFYGWIAPWKLPLQSTFSHTLHAHRVGLETGDIEYSCIGAHLYGVNAFFAGMPLPELEGSMRKFVDLMNKHKQGPWAAATAVQLQMIHNFMGWAEDPLILRGEIMTDEKVLEIATVQNMESYETYFVQVMVWSLLLAYHFGKLRQALATANDCREAVKYLGPSFLVCIQYFYDGMAALAAASDPKFERTKKQHIAVAKRALKKLQKVAKHSPENCLHKVYLLQAEFATVRGERDKAATLYSKSIALAHRNGFLQDAALAHERAGVALWHSSSDPKANIYLSRALDCYTLWGAEAKVEQLRCEYFQ